MKYRRLTALFLVCVFFLGGCAPLDALLQYVSLPIYDAQKYQHEFTNRWEYQRLSNEDKHYYGQLYTAVTDTMATDTTVSLIGADGTTSSVPGVRVTLPGATLSNAAIVRLYEAFYSDNPQFFYLDRTYSLEGQQNPDGSTYYNTITLQYTADATQRGTMAAALQGIVDTLLANCPQTDDQYVIEKHLHDRLNALCTYDMVAAESDIDTAPHAYTAYGALVEGKAVCEGYAKAMQLLLQKASIPVTLVTGSVKETSESHMWNLITIHGENYHLDATWNDTNDQALHTFFNLTTDMVDASYTIDDADALPQCTAVADNFFVRESTLVDTYERQIISRKIAERILAGDTTIQLRFTDGKYENGVLFLKNKTLMTSMVNACLADTSLSMWDYSLWADSQQQVLTLIKE